LFKIGVYYQMTQWTLKAAVSTVKVLLDFSFLR